MDLSLTLSDAMRLGQASSQPLVVAFTGGGGKSSALFWLAGEFLAQGKRIVTTTTTRLALAQAENAPVHLTLGDGELPIEVLSRELDEVGHLLLTGPPLPGGDALTGDNPERLIKAGGVAPKMVDELARLGSGLGIAAILVEADGSRMLPVKAPAEDEPVVPSSATHLVPVLGLDAIGKRIDAGTVHRVERLQALLSLPPEGDESRLTPELAARLLAHPEGGLKGRPEGATAVAILNKADDACRTAVGNLLAARLEERGLSSILTSFANSSPIGKRHEPWALTILAAGGSRRMGTPKQLLRVDGEPMICRALRTAMDTDAEKILLVIGAAAESVVDCAAPLLDLAGDRVVLVNNPMWHHGQSTSIQAAVEAVSGLNHAHNQHGVANIAGLLYMPVDQPFLAPSLLRRLVHQWRLGALIAASSVDGKLRGAPSLFDRLLWSELAQITGDIGARSLLKTYADRVVGVPAKARMLRDVDTQEDLRHLTGSTW